MKSASVAKGMLAGAVGGALGTLVLNLFQTASLEATRTLEENPEAKGSLTQQQEELLASYKSAHVRTAADVAGAAGAKIRPGREDDAAAVAEFAFGIVCGAVYGGLAEYIPAVTAGFGTVYGGVLFTGASEIVLPAMGFVPSPAERGAVQHAGGLSGNVVYGFVTEAVRRLLR